MGEKTLKSSASLLQFHRSSELNQQETHNQLKQALYNLFISNLQGLKEDVLFNLAEKVTKLATEAAATEDANFRASLKFGETLRPLTEHINLSETAATNLQTQIENAAIDDFIKTYTPGEMQVESIGAITESEGYGS